MVFDFSSWLGDDTTERQRGVLKKTEMGDGISGGIGHLTRGGKGFLARR